MTKALGVVFYRYTPRSDDHYKTQGELFLKYAKQFYPLTDKLYIVDAGWGFADEDLHPNTVKITDDCLSHWEYMNRITEAVTEDAFLLIDPDILIYDADIIEKGFALLETHDIGGILDNSGSFDFFPENKLRATRRRFTPYMTFMRMDLLRKIPNIDFTPTSKNGRFEFDSMGLLTKQILDLKPRQFEFPDDRTTLRLHPDGSMVPDSNMDGPAYDWSVPLKSPQRLGYYHVRNSSLGLSLLVEHEHDKPAYERRKSITPFQEALRLLAWQWIYDKYTGHLEEWRHTYEPVLEDYKVSSEVWEQYIRKFENFHSWIKE